MVQIAPNFYILRLEVVIADSGIGLPVGRTKYQDDLTRDLNNNKTRVLLLSFK